MRLNKSGLVVAVLLFCLSLVGCSSSKATENYKKDLSSFMKMNEYVSYIELDMFKKTMQEIENEYQEIENEYNNAYDEISKLEMMTQEGENIKQKYVELVKYVQTNLKDNFNDEDKYNKATQEMMSNDEEYISLANNVNKLLETIEKLSGNIN